MTSGKPPLAPSLISGGAPEPAPPLAPNGSFKLLARVVRVVFGVGAAVFIVLSARTLAHRWQGNKVALAPGFALIAVLPIIAGAWVQGWGWKKLMERMAGRKIPTGLCVALHVESQLARYTPGKVGMPLVRMSGAERIGVSSRVIGVSVFVEILSLLAVGGVVSFATLLATGSLAGEGAGLLGRWGTPVLCAFGLGTLLLLSVNRRFIPETLRRFVDDGGAGPVVPLRLPLVHVVYWATWVLHGYLVSRAVGATHGAGLAGSGLYALAPIIGFLALVTPGGLGVREFVLAMGLAPALGSAPAVGAAIASRAISLAGDVLAWLLFRPFGRARRDGRGAPA